MMWVSCRAYFPIIAQHLGEPENTASDTDFVNPTDSVILLFLLYSCCRDGLRYVRDVNEPSARRETKKKVKTKCVQVGGVRYFFSYDYALRYGTRFQ